MNKYFITQISNQTLNEMTNYTLSVQHQLGGGGEGSRG